MARQSIPVEAKQQVDAIVVRFNHEVIQDEHLLFYSYRGFYVYLDRKDGGRVSPRGRPKYTQAMDQWEFAIYKYSSETYDPDEWFFPGSQYFNGTVEGALKPMRASRFNSTRSTTPTLRLLSSGCVSMDRIDYCSADCCRWDVLLTSTATVSLCYPGHPVASSGGC